MKKVMKAQKKTTLQQAKLGWNCGIKIIGVHINFSQTKNLTNSFRKRPTQNILLQI
jgi:hypothetical protein